MTNFKKHIFILLAIIITLIVIFKISLAIILGIGLNGNYSKEKMKFYKEKEVRINYFNERSKSFNNIINILKKYPEINQVKINNCSSLDIKIKTYENISLCVLKDSTNIGKIKKLNLKDDIDNLQEIVSIEKRQTLNNDLYLDVAITFYIINSINGHIHYNYCLLKNECDSDDNYYKNENGIFEKNKIDDNWSSIYNSIPSM